MALGTLSSLFESATPDWRKIVLDAEGDPI